MVKSWTLTLWSYTKKMPPMVRWSLRIAYALPFLLFLLGLWLSDDRNQYVTGFVIGLLWLTRPAIRSWLRHYSVALVAARRTGQPQTFHPFRRK